METKYPSMRRPKRKLCYFTNTDSSFKNRAAKLTLEDIDKMFDDMDPSLPLEDDMLSPCPLVQTFDTETKENEVPPVSKEQQLPEVDLPPTTRTPSPKLDIDLDVQFKVHGPVKTSSPIEERLVSDRAEEPERKDKKGRVASPILLDCEDEEKEEAKMEPLPNQCNGHVTEDADSELEYPPCGVVLSKLKMPRHELESPPCRVVLSKLKMPRHELESPPCRVMLSKLKMTSHENKVEGLRSKESHTVKETAPKKPQTAVLEAKSKAPRPENPAALVSAVRQEPEVAAPKKKSKSVVVQPLEEAPTRVGKDMSTFLQKLRDAAQHKPACKRPSPVKAPPPPPPEPEEDFLILEDDSPLWFSIPSKTATSKKQRPNRSSNADKDSSEEREVNDGPLETAPKQQESQQENDKPRSQSDDRKVKKMKGREEKNKAPKLGNNMADLYSPEEQDLSADDAINEEKANKKKRLKKVPSKESDASEKRLKDTASLGTDEEQEMEMKMDKKALKSSDMKRSKSSKDGNEKSLKGGKKRIKGSGTVKETMHVDPVEEVNQEYADTEDPGSFSDREIITPVTEKSEEDEDNRTPAVTEERSSDDSVIIGRRKRKPPGQWWISSYQDAEDVDSGPRKSKQDNKEAQAAEAAAAAAAAAALPLKTKKGRVSKKSRQSQAAPSSSQNANKAKEKKSSSSRDTAHEMKAAEEVSDVTDAGQIEEQDEVSDQDLDSIHSSPLVFPPRDHRRSSVDQVFQRIYHVPPEKTPVRPAPACPQGSRNLAEQLRAAEAGRRRRKPPSDCWTLNGPQRQEPKPLKERKKQSKQVTSYGLVTPKKDNKADSLKPPRGSPVLPLKVRPPPALKTIKRSLATFKDTFSSPAETPTLVGSREAGQINRRKAPAPPAVEVTVTDCRDRSGTGGDVLSEDAGQSDRPEANREALQDSKCQSDTTLQVLRSGPSSMVDLEQYEEEDLTVPSSGHRAVLSSSDLYAPPLKPLSLQPKDKANLREWFKSLWSATGDSTSEITPDHFKWFFYQGRAIGFLVDLDCGSICNGKILLGSYMKKPLWVDHSATTVFNLLTSSVSVTIDGKESRYHPGQSFMVPCGHAYSIRNVIAQPAVLYFTRVLAESSD